MSISSHLHPGIHLRRQGLEQDCHVSVPKRSNEIHLWKIADSDDLTADKWETRNDLNAKAKIYHSVDCKLADIATPVMQ